MTVLANRSNRAGRHAELALEARVVIDGLVGCRDFRVHQNCPKENEVPELRMNDVPMNAHLSQARRHSDRFV